MITIKPLQLYTINVYHQHDFDYIYWSLYISVCSFCLLSKKFSDLFLRIPNRIFAYLIDKKNKLMMIDTFDMLGRSIKWLSTSQSLIYPESLIFSRVVNQNHVHLLFSLKHIFTFYYSENVHDSGQQQQQEKSVCKWNRSINSF